jgi:hypothetical protein
VKQVLLAGDAFPGTSATPRFAAVRRVGHRATVTPGTRSRGLAAPTVSTVPRADSGTYRLNGAAGR